MSNRRNLSLPSHISAQVKLNHLVQCNCCPRHQTNKPSELKPWVELPLNDQTRDNPCDCDCRHKARWICRDMFEQENKEA